MTFDLQNSIVLGMVLAATTYLGRRVYRLCRTTGDKGCGSGCGTCSAPTASLESTTPATVTIAPLKK